jgi:DNA polymerase eta
VPTAHGKADLTIYRTEGAKVLKLLARGADAVERASIDEVFLDLSSAAAAALESRSWESLVASASGCSTNVAGVENLPLLSRSSVRRGHSDEAASPDAGVLSALWLSRDRAHWSAAEQALLAGAALVAEGRQSVLSELLYTTSAGIAHNKLLAKLASGLKKPASQTLVPLEGTATLLRDLPLSRLRGLGGKLGERVTAELGVTTAGGLSSLPLARVESALGAESAAFVLALARGESDAPVKQRENSAQLGSSKTFRGYHGLTTMNDVHKWLTELAEELVERLDADGRIARQLTVQFTSQAGSMARSCALHLPASRMAEDATSLVRSWAAGEAKWTPISVLGLCAGLFEAEQVGAQSLSAVWAKASAAPASHPASAPMAAVAAMPDGEAVEPEAQTTLCPTCGAAIAPEAAAEHSDWHAAKEFQKQIREADAAERRAQQKKRPAPSTAPLESFFRKR